MPYITAWEIKVLVQVVPLRKVQWKAFKANSCKQESVCHSSFHHHPVFTSKSLTCFLFRRLLVVTFHSLRQMGKAAFSNAFSLLPTHKDCCFKTKGAF